MTDPDDKESVDRAFAELVAGFHLTADRPEPPNAVHEEWDGPPTGRAPAPGSVFERPTPLPPAASPPALPTPEPADETEPQPADRFEPEPPPPLPRPAWPVLVGWIGLGYAVLMVLATAVGIELPRWAAWAGIVGFAGGFALLVSRLPRQRPPDAGDGAVL
ncbi:MAG TPA: hypothetical protein VIT65_10640 [Microlunatus sp.]